LPTGIIVHPGRYDRLLISAVALDEFELMLTALAAHRLPILNRVCWSKLRGEFVKQMGFGSYPVECRIGSEHRLLQHHPLRAKHEMHRLFVRISPLRLAIDRFGKFRHSDLQG
jgi:hypothetical protein